MCTGESRVRVGTASDDASFGLEEDLLHHLRESGYEIVDVDAYTLNPTDNNPDFVIPLKQLIVSGEVDAALPCAAVGLARRSAPTKLRECGKAGSRPFFEEAKGGDDDMNVMCIGGRVVGAAAAQDLVDLFLNARLRRNGMFTTFRKWQQWNVR
jgi:ribose 5-phosphate isomerase B